MMHGAQTKTFLSTLPSCGTVAVRNRSSLGNTFLPPLRRSFRSVVRFANEQENNQTPKRRFITREEEPDQYWLSKGEREGSNPMKDPLAIIGVLAILTPFIIIGVAVAVGYLDLTP